MSAEQLNSIEARFGEGAKLTLIAGGAGDPKAVIIYQERPGQRAKSAQRWEYTNAHDALQAYNAKVRRLAAGGQP